MYSFSPIAEIRTPFREKFGIPRQAALADGIYGTIVFTKAYGNPDYIRGIEAFSHLWLTFVFDQHLSQQPSALIRPPRLGGNKKIGVMASRSSFRPNPIGLSLVRYVSHEFINGRLELTVSGVDLVDKTPILDIKPYIAYSDCVPDAVCGYAPSAPVAQLNVNYIEPAQIQLNSFAERYPTLPKTLDIMLSQDPRPAYKREKVDSKTYHVGVFDLDVTFNVEGAELSVINIEKVE